MKKILISLALPLVMVLMVTPVLAQSALPFSTDLVADGRGEAPVVGELSVAGDGTIVFAVNEAATAWLLDETHLYVGDVPPEKSAPGQFEYGNCDLGGVASDEVVVDLAAYDLDGDGVVWIAAHAALIMEAGVDEVTGELLYAYESAWAQGEQSIGKGKNWATCFSVVVPAAEPVL